MKTIKQEANSYYSEFYMESSIPDREAMTEMFIAGVEFAQRWIPVEEELPEYAEELLLELENGHHEVGYYLRKKGHKDAFYSYVQPNIDFILYDVIRWRPIELK
jgi:hypothetical protein